MNGARVIFCAYDNPGNVSGPNTWLRRLLPRLRDGGLCPEAWFFSLNPGDSPTAAALERQGVRTRKYPFLNRTQAKVRWLLERVAEDPPAVFIPNLVIPAYFASTWIHKVGIPTVGVMHSDDPFYHAVTREFAGPAGHSLLSDLVCVSHHLRAELTPRVDASVELHTIPCGVPIPDMVASPPSDTLELVYVGRLTEEQKRASDVARALCQAVREVPGVSARIIGDGSALPALRRIIRGQGGVELVGRIDSDRMQAELLRSHAIVLLSDYEGLPIALMEGMGCGLVPICTRIQSGIPELISHGENGLLVDDRGDGFVAAVRMLRESHDTWVRLSAAARATVESRYSIDVSVRQWCELLRGLVNNAGSRTPISAPERFDLPPVQPEFAREDFRRHHIVDRAMNRIRRRARSR